MMTTGFIGSRDSSNFTLPETPGKSAAFRASRKAGPSVVPARLMLSNSNVDAS